MIAGTDRRQTLSGISGALQWHAQALQALTEPGDQDLPIGIRLLLDAIDRVDLAATTSFDVRVPA